MGLVRVSVMIDWGRVVELRDEIGADAMAEVVELFLEEVDEVVARLAAAPATASYETDLHFLKGSAWNLGFTDFGRLCQDGERLAAAGSAHAVDLTAILQAYAMSRAEFLSRLADLTTPGSSVSAA